MRTAIVTGAGSGIGRAVSLKLARMGYAVALAGRTARTLEKVGAEIDEQGLAKALIVRTDVANAGDIKRLVRRVLKHWGRVDVLVNNAGYAPSVPTHQVTEKQWRKILDTNLSAAFHATRLVWGAMKKQRGGVIINISSMAAKDPFPGLGAYGVAKAGLNMLTLATAREGDADGIRVVAIAPASVDTPMFRALVGEKNVKTDEILAPDDVAQAIADAVEGSLRYSSGDTIYLHRRPT